MNKQRKEKGQALVVLMLAVVGLFGIAALAIDGGSAYANRRNAQNSADAAAFAGATVLAQGGTNSTAYAAAIQRAITNKFNDSDASANTTDTKSNIEVYHPPISGPYQGNSEYIQVFLTSSVDTFFAKVIGWNVVTSRVESVVQGRPPVKEPYFGGNALAALKPGPDCTGLTFAGNGEVLIEDSGIFINNNSTSCAFLQNGCASYLTMPDGTINIVGNASLNGNCAENVGGTDNFTNTAPALFPPVYFVPRPAECDPKFITPAPVEGKGNKTISVSPDIPPYTDRDGTPLFSLTDYEYDAIFSPGRYDTFPPNGMGNAIIYMKPGIYCITGSFTPTSTSIVGKEVMFYVENGSGGGFTWNAGGVQCDPTNPKPKPSCNLSNPKYDPNRQVFYQLTPPTEYSGYDPDKDPYYGMLVYVDPGPIVNNWYTDAMDVCKINGASTSKFIGTIYAPYCNVTISGTGDPSGMYSQIIGYTITLSGDNGLKILFFPGDNGGGFIKPRIDLAK